MARERRALVLQPGKASSDAAEKVAAVSTTSTLRATITGARDLLEMAKLSREIKLILV